MAEAICKGASPFYQKNKDMHEITSSYEDKKTIDRCFS
jgi:hypothetical protein